MYSEPNGPHNMPHIHAEYQGANIVIGLDGELITGSIPSKQLKLVQAWIAIHEDELKANWQLLLEGQKFFRIEPLR
jgi:hypothetical protein